MARTIRSFIAVNLNASRSLRRLLGELSAMGRPVRPVAPDRLHITLKFLGDVPLDSLVPISSALEEAVHGIGPFSLTIRGTGAFPRPERPSVIWAGIEESQPIAVIATNLERCVSELGFPRENRPFRPHATLAYVKAKPPPQLADLLLAHADTVFGTQEVTSVELMQSEPGPTGPRYTPMHTATLQTGS